MTATLAVVLLVYFGIILGIAVWSSFRTKTEEDFIAAGRTIGPFVGGAVLAATQISAGTVVGTLGRHYLAGVSWWWVWLGVWAGWLVSAFFVAPKLRRFGALTVPDYIAARFGSETARALAAMLIVVSYTIYLVAQFQASGEIARIVLWVAFVPSVESCPNVDGLRPCGLVEVVEVRLSVAGGASMGAL